MDVVGQIREGELRPDQLEIGKVYRMVQYGRPNPDVPHRLIDESLGMFNKIWGEGRFMEFTIVAPGTSNFWRGRKIDTRFDTSPMDNYYWRFFQTAEDRLVTPFKQQALQEVFNKRIDPATAWGLSDGWFARNPKRARKTGGRKYKTRQTKLRRKNRTRKNRRR